MHKALGPISSAWGEGLLGWRWVGVLVVGEETRVPLWIIFSGSVLKIFTFILPVALPVCISVYCMHTVSLEARREL